MMSKEQFEAWLAEEAPEALASMDQTKAAWAETTEPERMAYLRAKATELRAEDKTEAADWLDGLVTQLEEITTRFLELELGPDFGIDPS